MLKTDRRSEKRFNSRYGHKGSGSVHTRQASEAEVRRHVKKAKDKVRRNARIIKNLMG